MKKILALVFISGILAHAATQTTFSGSASDGVAEENFRRGVQSYYRGSFNEAILEFEKTLSYVPGENRVLDWLGKAYYRAGIEGAALQQWEYALKQGYGGILLQNRIEIVSQRRGDGNTGASREKYTESGSFPYRNGTNLVYSQPVSCLPERDGTIWVVASGSNELLRFDVNGVVIDRNRGPLNGFDRPLDIIRLIDGNLLVTESKGNRLSLLSKDGRFIKTIGQKGTGNGSFVGPQYLAQDVYGNIYVTDFGNKRVCVLDSQGNALFSFGKKTPLFEGLAAPTGIAVCNGSVFVADSIRGAIYQFDLSGNYLGVLVEEGTFRRPESMKVWENSLIVCDINRVVAVDTQTGALFENARTGNGNVRITCAVPDANGNLIVTDCYANEIYVYANMNELVGGLFVQLERVISDSFPEVTLEVRVENRKRRQIVGLKETNFLITEKNRPVMNMRLEGSASNNDFADIVILVDRSLSMKKYEDELYHAVREITATMTGKENVTVISAGEIPVTEWNGSSKNLDFNPRTLKAPYSSKTSLELALRLSANSLINRGRKHGIIYLTDGTIPTDSFVKYSLSDLSAYLNNNGISFSTVLLKNAAPDDEITYISDSTEGKTYYIYNPSGLKNVMSDIVSLNAGLYQIKYTSSLTTDYGRDYLPVEVEAYLLNRSGRDESGYFAPLK